jgi:hypothetical protein
MQHCLKTFCRSARAGIIPPQLFEQFFVAMNDALTALDLGFRGITLASFAHDLKRKIPVQIRYRYA